MGWTGQQLRGRPVDRTFFEREFRGMTFHDFHEAKGGVFYIVAERPSKPGERFAVVVVTEREGDWIYYSENSEHMGPYYYDCPARLLDLLTPTASAEANSWREKCRASKPRRAKAQTA